MWLINSSVGRKFVMAITGVCLVLFVTFHVLMNSVAIFWPAAYNSICEFLGANWYALVASMGLALLFIIHIVYALWLTWQNRNARGADRYAVTARQPQVEWSSKNMLVLGIVVVAFLVVHMIQFWAKMQWVELRHVGLDAMPQIDGVPAQPAMGTLFLQLAFQNTWTPVVYIIGFIALWFHMNHGFWSMFHTVGWNNNIWLPRLKCIAKCWTSVVVGLFIVQAVVFTYRANENYYTKAPELQAQYAEGWEKQAEAVVGEFNDDINRMMAEFKNVDPAKMDMQKQMELQDKAMKAQEKFIAEKGQYYVDQVTIIENGMKALCPDVTTQGNDFASYNQAVTIKRQLEQMLNLPALPKQ